MWAVNCSFSMLLKSRLSRLWQELSVATAIRQPVVGGFFINYLIPV